MRHLKKGSLGAAAVLTGFFAPKLFGGFYQQGEKRRKGDIPPDAGRVAGVNIPANLIHAPLLTAAQLGATIRHTADSKLRKKDAETQGLSHGALAGAVGLADATPFIRETTEIAKFMNSYRARPMARHVGEIFGRPAGGSVHRYRDRQKRPRQRGQSEAENLVAIYRNRHPRTPTERPGHPRSRRSILKEAVDASRRRA